LEVNMKTVGIGTKVMMASVVFFVLSAAVQAQATRTWVSGVGDDANPCSRTAPCKTFAGAISKTAAGGEISVLDPGGYGAVTITKSITINGDGTLASILASGTNGVIVNAGVNDVVILRNLSINGAGTGLSGIRYLAGKVLRVESCTVYGFLTHGIDVLHTSTTVPGELIVSNSSFTKIAGTAVRVDNAVGAVAPSATVDNVQISEAAIGFYVRRAGLGTISNSVISHVTNEAVLSESISMTNVVGCTLSKNGIGASVQNNAVLSLESCQVFHNTTGVRIAATAMGVSFGNNAILGNGLDINGTLMSAMLK
jgi:hypothetical protein